MARDSRKTEAKAVYCGRGFSEMLRASTHSRVNLSIISAGLGLIGSDQKIPAYNLTISASSGDCIQSRVIPTGSFVSSQWWSGLNQVRHATPTPLADLISNNPHHLFVLCLSRAYAEMIEEDVLSLEDGHLDRIRIIGLGRDYTPPVRLVKTCMPYDERFDGPDNDNVGTRSDFPQRAGRHFIEHVAAGAEETSAAIHAGLVTSFLEGKRMPAQIKRPVKTDEEIKQIIRLRWHDAAGKSTTMLRILRDDEMVACEQKRFSLLFRTVKAERNERN